METFEHEFFCVFWFFPLHYMMNSFSNLIFSSSSSYIACSFGRIRTQSNSRKDKIFFSVGVATAAAVFVCVFYISMLLWRDYTFEHSLDSFSIYQAKQMLNNGNRISMEMLSFRCDMCFFFWFCALVMLRFLPHHHPIPTPFRFGLDFVWLSIFFAVLLLSSSSSVPFFVFDNIWKWIDFFFKPNAYIFICALKRTQKRISTIYWHCFCYSLSSWSVLVRALSRKAIDAKR